MNQTAILGGPGVRWRVPIAAALAMLAASASLAIAISASWQRSVTEADRWLIAGVNLIAVLAAQLLPALGQRLSLATKCVCASLWLTCVAYTAQGQAGFLLAAQERSGMARAEAVMAGEPLPPDTSRDLPTILNDKARATEQFAHTVQWPCADACAMRMQSRRAALEDRLKALDAEAEATQDRRRRRVQVEAQARQVQADVVGAHLAAALGVGYGVTTGVTALIFALILEGVGCFCWSLVLKSSTSDHATRPEVDVAVDSPEWAGSHDESLRGCEADFNGAASQELGAESSAHSLADDIARVADAVRDSKIALTVAAVRIYLRCGQQRAAEVRRGVGALLATATPVTD